MISIGYDIDERFIIVVIFSFALTKQDSIVVNINSGYLKFEEYVFTPSPFQFFLLWMKGFQDFVYCVTRK